jgi:protein ImuB
MPRIMTIWLPRWPVQRRLLEKPRLRRAPVFVCRRERRGVMTVVAWAWAAPPRGNHEDGPGHGRLNPAAKIPAGMSLAEGMAVLALAHGSRACHVAEVDHDDPAADRMALEELARYCRRFAPIVALEDAERPECLHVDVTGTAGFFGGEGPLVRTAVWTLAARGIHARAAIADTPTAAWAAAHHTDLLHRATDLLHRATDMLGRAAGRPAGRSLLPRHRRWAVVPKGEQWQALAGLPAAALQLGDDVLAQLRDVGIDSIGGIARLPRKSLASRFGPRLSLRIAQLTGERAEPLAPPCSDELPTASHSFDIPILLRDTTADDLGVLVERLVGECVSPLAVRGRGVLALQVRLERSQCADPRAACMPTANVAPLVIDVGLFQPSANVKHLVDLVRLRMERMRMPSEIEGIAVDVVAIGEIACRQRTLFESHSGLNGADSGLYGAGSGAASASAHEVGMLFDRLSGRLGRGAVFVPQLVADAQPEHAWAPTPPAAKKAATSMAVPKAPAAPRSAKGSGGVLRGDLERHAAPERRPLWMLPRPVPLEAVSVAPDGPPVRFRHGSETHEIAKAHGPERIETAWWRGPTVRRDYYVVETKTGARYWLFRRLRGGEWFLHGMFG